MPEESQFRTEHFQDAPRGWHVKTITHPSGHEVRVAFPKGPRKRGSGRLVSILHPHENPGCGLTKNPIEWEAKWEDLKQKVQGWLTQSRKGVKPNAKRNYTEEVRNGISEQFESKSEGIEAAKYICSQYNVKTFVYWFPRAIPPRGRVVDAKGAEKYQGQDYAKLIFTCSPKMPADNPRSRRNYTEEVRTSEGKTVFIDVLGSGEKWTAEGYPVVAGRIRRVGKPLIAHGRSEADAYDNLIDKLERNPGRARNMKAKRNLDEIEAAAELAERFKGSPAEEVHELGEPDKMRDDFAHLGWENQLVFVPPTFHGDLDCKAIGNFYDARIQEHDDTARAWKETQEEFNIPLLVYDVSEDEIRLVSSADRKQLYFIGGNQKAFRGALKDFRTNLNRDKVDLGELLSTTYIAEKAQVGDDGPRPYYHTFGEDGGYPPGAIYDTMNDRILLFGGTYHLEEAERGIIN